MSETIELYQVLEVSRQASEEEIRQAFRQKAKKHHPDKGGDAEHFKRINLAYEILSNKEKRALYDQHGLDGLKRNINPMNPMANPFEAMFQNIFTGMGNLFNSIQKMPPIVYRQTVTLEQLCQRNILTVQIARNRKCECLTENKEQAVCTTCQGKGQVTTLQQIGPMRVQMIGHCPACKGTGRGVMPCTKGQGCQNGLIEQTKQFDIHLTPEMATRLGTPYVIANEGNEHISNLSGDIHVILQYEPHTQFKISGHDLTYTCSITLCEALCGFTQNIRHPNGDTIEMTIDTVTTPSSVHTFQQYGLTEQGALLVSYNIVFPDTLSEQQRKTLSDCLKV